MNRLALLGLILFVIAAPAAAQDMGAMLGMTMPAPKAKPPAKPVPAKKRPAVKPPAAAPSDPHAGHDMSTMPGMTPPEPAPQAPATPDTAMADKPGMKGAETPAAGHDMAAMPGMTAPEIPKSPPPSAPKDYAADQVFDPAAMTAARRTLRQEHGGAVVSQVIARLAEYRTQGGGGYRWDGEAWFGGDINRLVLKSEGEGMRRDGLEAAELQALYSRAIGPYFDLQAGVRQDFEPKSRTYATVGFEGLAPYWFDVEGAVFLSTKGELLGRLEGSYDLRLSQRLILQPRAELSFSAQDTAETQTGSGLSNAELGLRLRYEVSREFAPYIGISYERKFGGTADYSRAAGDGAESTSFVVGVRAWF